jgi:hypothetical protein
MNWFKVNGIQYNVIVTSLEENFNILYSDKTGRTIATGAPLTLDPLGTFFGHKITIKRMQGFEDDFDNLYKIVSKPIVVEEEEDALLFEIAHLQSTITYRGYVSNGTRPLIRIDENTNKLHWGELTLNITPIKAQEYPE